MNNKKLKYSNQEEVQMCLDRLKVVSNIRPDMTFCELIFAINSNLSIKDISNDKAFEAINKIC